MKTANVTRPMQAEPNTRGCPGEETRGSAAVMGSLIAVMSLVYSLAMFRGIDGHSVYHGSVYQVLHPGSFPNDAFMSPIRPIMLSLYYYVIVPVVGTLWLDDRFIFIVSLGLAALTLVAVDKTAQCFGAHRVGERAAIVSLMLLGHTILENNAFVVSGHGFNPTNFVNPFIIWLFSHSLAGHSPLAVLSLLALAVSISVKNAWLPSLIAVVLLCRDRVGRRGQRIAWAVVLGLVAATVGGYYAFGRPPDGSHAALFDYILREVEDREANPFMNSLAGNLSFVALCVAGCVVKGLDAAMAARVRVVAGMGLAVWLVGGLYLTYAPEAIKVPYLVTFAPTRALWWPQYVVYVALGVAFLKWLQRASSSAGVCGAWAGLMVLYFMHNTFRIKLALVVAVTSLVMLWRSRSLREHAGRRTATERAGGWRLSTIDPQRRLRIAAVAMCVGAVSLYGIGTRHRVAALAWLARYGIMGDNTTAVWVGVNEYIRAHTPPSATVLALVARDALGKEIGLQYGESLRSRTGRSMPVGAPPALYFDYEKLRWRTVQVQHLAELLAAWEGRDGSNVSTHLAALGSPDYLVVPTEKSQWVRDVPGFAYAVETVIGEYLIMRKLAGVSGGGAERSSKEAVNRRVGETG